MTTKQSPFPYNPKLNWDPLMLSIYDDREWTNHDPSYDHGTPGFDGKGISLHFNNKVKRVHYKYASYVWFDPHFTDLDPSSHDVSHEL